MNDNDKALLKEVNRLSKDLEQAATAFRLTPSATNWNWLETAMLAYQDAWNRCAHMRIKRPGRHPQQ